MQDDFNMADKAEGSLHGKPAGSFGSAASASRSAVPGDGAVDAASEQSTSRDRRRESNSDPSTGERCAKVPTPIAVPRELRERILSANRMVNPDAFAKPVPFEIADRLQLPATWSNIRVICAVLRNDHVRKDSGLATLRSAVVGGLDMARKAERDAVEGSMLKRWVRRQSEGDAA
jgi:hypothetical protein